ncbi:MBL fold metallo-hydrolase, partial [bacterium]|nr:MBL fold metallo-hydrolase [bacterium]
MKIKFLGGIEQVTGSCCWCKTDSIEFLVDCGMIQGESHSHFENNKNFLFNPKNIKFVILTHAHLDHCGLIPKLYKDGFIGKVYCTKATSKIAIEILIDAVGISAPFEKENIDQIEFELFDERPDFKWGILNPIDKDLFLSFYRSSHVLGAISAGISWKTDPINKEKKINSYSIFFSGDIGNNINKNLYLPLMKKRHSPGEKFKYVVAESTYGDRNRENDDKDFKKRIDKLKNIIIKTIEKGGRLIIPAFSFHRTQEILFDLYYLLMIDWNEKKHKDTSFMNFLFKNQILDNSYLLYKQAFEKRVQNEILKKELELFYKKVYIIEIKKFNNLKEKNRNIFKKLVEKLNISVD